MKGATMKNFSKSLFSAIGLILVLTAPVFGQGDPKADPKEVKKVVATVDADGVQRVKILGGGYFYDPNYVVVKVNVPVELSLTKESGMTPHDFVIKAPEAGIEVNVSLDVKPQLIKFTPTKTGKYPIICTKKMVFMKSHKDKGMEGMLEVTE
jgi:plastocyanin domain-containing protein